MQDDPLSCDEARRFSAQHLEHCDACLDACLEDALRRPAGVVVPERFGQRVLASLPAVPPPARTPWDLWPVAAACVPALLGAALWWSGTLPDISGTIPLALQHPAVLAAVGALEMAFALLWAVRVEASE
jgi:hypothetical protein